MTTIRMKHTKVSGKGASADTSKVDGPAWDDSHAGVAADIKTDLGLATVASSGAASDLTGTLAAAQMPALTGDVTTSAGAVATTLATVNSNVGSFTSANVTVNAKGLVTAAANGSGGGGGGAVTASAGSFGFGVDGAAVFDGSSAVTNFTRSGSVYTATKPDYFFTTVTFSSGVSVDMTQAGAVASARFFSNAGITVTSGTATIKMDGVAASGQTGGAALGTGHTGATSGAGAGSNQNAGANATAHSGNWPTNFQAGKGGHGGASATNAGSTTDIGATTILADSVGTPGLWHGELALGRIGLSNSGILTGGGGGGSGGGTTGVAAGGAGGGGAGVLIGGATTVTGNLTVTANGGAGSNGAGGNAGGGSGGGGGYVLWSGGGTTQPGGLTLNANGGAAGTAVGIGSSAGGAGNAGQAKFFPLGAS